MMTLGSHVSSLSTHLPQTCVSSITKLLNINKKLSRVSASSLTTQDMYIPGLGIKPLTLGCEDGRAIIPRHFRLVLDLFVLFVTHRSFSCCIVSKTLLIWEATFSADCLSCRFVLHKLLRCCCVWEKSLQRASRYPDAKNTCDWLYFWGLTVISYYMLHWLQLKMMCPLRYSQSQ